MQTLEELHSRLATALGTALIPLVAQETKVDIASAQQSTFPQFGRALSYPYTCIYHGIMQPASGRIAFALGWPLVWELIEHLSNGAHSVNRDEVPNLENDEIHLINQAAKVVIDCLQKIWKDVLAIELADIMLETSTKAILGEMPSDEIKAKFTPAEIARIIGWVPAADEPIVHVALAVQIGNLSSTIDFCYTPAALDTALPHLGT